MQAFTYMATVKLIVSQSIPVLSDEYPGITDLSLNSREFIDYNECLLSCRTFMESMKNRINEKSGDAVFMLSSEINPKFSGQATLSKDWDQGEIARLWIFDEKMQKTGMIQALGQARVFSTDHPKSITLAS